MKRLNILLQEGNYRTILNKLQNAFKSGVFDTIIFLHTTNKAFRDLHYLIGLCKKNQIKNIIVCAGKNMNLNIERLMEAGLTEIKYID